MNYLNITKFKSNSDLKNFVLFYEIRTFIILQIHCLLKYYSRSKGNDIFLSFLISADFFNPFNFKC